MPAVHYHIASLKAIGDRNSPPNAWPKASISRIETMKSGASALLELKVVLNCAAVAGAESDLVFCLDPVAMHGPTCVLW